MKKIKSNKQKTKTISKKTKETILIVGASANPKKYGHKILNNLLYRGFNAIPINPKENEICGVEVYKSLTDFVQKNPKITVDWVDFVVPPLVTEKLLQEVKKLKLKRVWMQPKSQSDYAIRYCKKNNIHCVHHACIMANYE